MKKILNVSEMKQVRGGAQASSLCGEGEQLYTCSTSWMSGTVTQGSVCAKSASAAHAAVSKVHMDQGVIRDERIWDSPNLEYEGINVKCW